jgi:hypothetical protein
MQPDLRAKPFSADDAAALVRSGSSRSTRRRSLCRDSARPNRTTTAISRVKALISIAHPDFREDLAREARENKMVPRTFW